MGLLTWTSGDPWESFLVVAAFWAVVLYGEVLVRYGGNVLVIVGLAVGMFLRRFKKGALIREIWSVGRDADGLG